MLCSGQHHKILGPIVKRVVVDVMHHPALSDRSIVFFVNDASTQTPDVGFRHLHKRPTVVSSRSVTHPFRSDRNTIMRGVARLEFCCLRYVRTFGYSVTQVSSTLGRTLIRTIVGLSPFGWPAMERCSTNRTGNRSQCCGTTQQGASIRFSAPTRAVDESRLVPMQSVGLDRKVFLTVAALNVHTVHDSGSDTTIPVARDRVGPMFLEVVA